MALVPPSAQRSIWPNGSRSLQCRLWLKKGVFKIAETCLINIGVSEERFEKLKTANLDKRGGMRVIQRECANVKVINGKNRLLFWNKGKVHHVISHRVTQSVPCPGTLVPRRG